MKFQDCSSILFLVFGLKVVKCQYIRVFKTKVVIVFIQITSIFWRRMPVNRDEISIFFARIFSLRALKVLAFLSGLFSLAPVIAIFVKTRPISLYNICFILFQMILIVRIAIHWEKSQNISNAVTWIGKSRKINRTFLMLLFWLFWSLIASSYGILKFGNLFQADSIIKSYAIKVISYLLLVVFIKISNDKKQILDGFLRGFYVAILANLLWAILDGVVYELFGFSINNYVFAHYARNVLPDGRQLSLILHDGSFRASGFNFDPAHIGGIVAIFFTYSVIKGKISGVIIALLGVVFSQSTTGLACIVMSTIANYKTVIALVQTACVSLKNKFSGSIVSKYLNYRVLKAIGVISVLIMFFLLWVQLYPMIGRIIDVYILGTSGNPRVLYHLLFLTAALGNGISSIVGTGFGTASIPYLLYTEFPKMSKEKVLFRAYDPESTYISYFFDTGLIGIVVYSTLVISLLKYYAKTKTNSNQMLYAALFGTIASGFFYHYILTSYQVIIIILASVFAHTPIKSIREELS